ncbi:hypothetical protein LEP1GSC175_3889 [Leptospira santarosai str. HAI821]|nr:hypothetical protein LEP1GSC040_0267 [Leptospira santarosai str. 2000030832]EMO13192.1 hypothetical protein LEP1GSC165_0145 [Leptospira santarosai str. CBC523]EMO30946.1 hypothetical protein LEP1GSC175_3889 [Leptospira santarosai str. HAI821]
MSKTALVKNKRKKANCFIHIKNSMSFFRSGMEFPMFVRL